MTDLLNAGLFVTGWIIICFGIALATGSFEAGLAISSGIVILLMATMGGKK